MKRHKLLLSGLWSVTLVGAYMLGIWVRSTEARSTVLERGTVSEQHHPPDKRMEVSISSDKTIKPPANEVAAAKLDLENPDSVGAEVERERIAFQQHPDFEKAINANRKRFILQSYGDLQKNLGIDAKTANRVSTLLVEKCQAATDTTEIVLQKKSPGELPNYLKAVDSATSEIDEELRRLLGEEKFKSLELVQSTERYRQDIEQKYASDFRNAEIPLSEAQTRALAEVIAINTTSAPRGGADKIAYDVDMLRPFQRAVLQDAAGILTSKQVATLRQSFIDANTEAYYKKMYTGTSRQHQ